MENSEILQKAALFSDMAAGEIEAALACLGARERSYGKNEALLRAGEAVQDIGLLLAGSALIVQEDYWGNRNLIARIAPGQLFAEAFACGPAAVLSVSVFAEDGCRVLWLSAGKLLHTCPAACPHHTRMIRNLMADLAAKNLRLSEKITHMGRRTTREKLLSYLSAEARRQGSAELILPLNRQQLADYLAVERSAMCAELSRLRADGRLEYHKNHFRLL